MFAFTPSCMVVAISFLLLLVCQTQALFSIHPRISIVESAAEAEQILFRNGTEVADSRSTTTSLVILHYTDPDTNADAGQPNKATTRKFRPFAKALGQALESQRPLRPGTPFVEVLLLNKADDSIFSAFKGAIPDSQVRMGIATTSLKKMTSHIGNSPPRHVTFL